MKKNNNKGFTLMEMLIVVAIIAVLVAIVIYCKSFQRQCFPRRRIKSDLFSLLILQCIRQRIKAQVARNGKRHSHFR